MISQKQCHNHQQLRNDYPNVNLRFESDPLIWEIGRDLEVSNGSVSSDVCLPPAISPEGNVINCLCSRGPAAIDPSPPSAEGGDDWSEIGREVEEENREVPAAPGPSIPSARGRKRTEGQNSNPADSKHARSNPN
ncbi:unnamed protein product [Orchesella dallaii]|uniref:Uncharacterized protein n=1 Tax=Orchesella dallaii TaxID=48710 RepID=A0ABP1S5D9_9HEXA